jgi:hypothetical protein
MKTLATIVVVTVLGPSAATAALSMSVVKPVADPGIYTGTAAGRPVAFFVSSSGRSLLDVSIPLTDLACAPAGSGANDALIVLKAAIKPGGAFSARGSQSGAFAGFPARYSYSFVGRFSRATKLHTGTAAGTFREDIRYTDQTGAHQTCTTNSKSWTATRSGPKLKALLASGNYTGTAGGRALTFAAAPGKVNTVTIPLTDLSCVPHGGGANDTTFAIPHLAIKADGSFNARGSTTGVFGGATATFSYSFSGTFQGANASHVGSAAGVFREDIAFTDNAGVHQTCTTNTKAWVAARTS